MLVSTNQHLRAPSAGFVGFWRSCPGDFRGSGAKGSENWKYGSDSNRRIESFADSAIRPLWYRTMLQLYIILEGMSRFELELSESKSHVLPLHHTPSHPDFTDALSPRRSSPVPPVRTFYIAPSLTLVAFSAYCHKKTQVSRSWVSYKHRVLADY